jgi:hypothetical protein
MEVWIGVWTARPHSIPVFIGVCGLCRALTPPKHDGVLGRGKGPAQEAVCGETGWTVERWRDDREEELREESEKAEKRRESKREARAAGKAGGGGVAGNAGSGGLEALWRERWALAQAGRGRLDWDVPT